MEQTALAAAQDIDFSLLALFTRATVTVQLVMVLLILASFWSWGIIIQKSIRYRRARAEIADFDAAFWSGEPLDELFDQLGPEPPTPPARVFAAGMTEWRRSHRHDGVLIPGAVARIDRSMDVAITKEARDFQRGLTFLATVGSAAPFVGLFGTVWGIINAFTQIAAMESTSLAVVAPGIAEALLSTALGLMAAVPATIYYNMLSDESETIISGFEAFADEFNTILSRQLDAA